MIPSLAILALAAALAAAAPAQAQQQPAPAVQDGLERGSVISPILTINSDRLFSESAYGTRVREDINARLAELEAENRKVEAGLELEERALTAKRTEMPPEEFRVLADAFDAKVQQIRAEQDGKLRALDELQVRERDTLLAAAAPVLERLMRESGAVVILERRQVWASVTAVEITEEAIALLNETLGSGPEAPEVTAPEKP